MLQDYPCLQRWAWGLGVSHVELKARDIWSSWLRGLHCCPRPDALFRYGTVRVVAQHKGAH